MTSWRPQDSKNNSEVSIQVTVTHKISITHSSLTLKQQCLCFVLSFFLSNVTAITGPVALLRTCHCLPRTAGKWVTLFLPWNSFLEVKLMKIFTMKEEPSFMEKQRKDLVLDCFTPFSVVFTVAVVEIARKMMRKGKELFKYHKNSFSSGNCLIRSCSSELRLNSILIKIGNSVIVKIPLRSLMLK